MDYWLKQTKDKPLFPELEWSKPENKMHAGKLLVVGGNLHGFAAPAEAYSEAIKAGAGTVRVVLPAAIQKLVGTFLPDASFAPSTKTSGSFSQKALDELLASADWADHVFIAGDLGRNSETAIMLEKFLDKSPIPTTITKDAVDYIVSAPQTALSRSGTTLVLSLSQLQRLGTSAGFEKAITFSMDLIRLVEWLHEFTSRYKLQVVVKHHEYIAVAVSGQASTTKTDNADGIWRLKTATASAVWQMQHPAKQFEALTAAVL